MKPKTLLPRMLAIMVTMLLSWNSLFADEYEYFKIGDTKIPIISYEWERGPSPYYFLKLIVNLENGQKLEVDVEDEGVGTTIPLDKAGSKYWRIKFSSIESFEGYFLPHNQSKYFKEGTLHFAKFKGLDNFKVRFDLVHATLFGSPFRSSFYVFRDSYSPKVRKGSFSASASAHSVTLSWEKAIDNISDQKALKYRIYQRIVDDSGDIDWKLLKIVSDVDSYTVKDLSEGEEYVFDVEAMDEKGNRASYTDDSGLRVTTPDVSAPHLGDILGEGGDGFVELCWPAATDNVTSPEKMKYKIYKWSIIKIVGRRHFWGWKFVQELQGKAGSNCFTIPSLANNNKYSFKVVAIDEAGNSSKGKEITVFTKDTEAPKPLELTIGKITEHSVELHWTPTTDNRTESQNLQYSVYRKRLGEPWSKLATFTGSETTSYTIKGLMPETVYEISLDVLDAAMNRRETKRTITTLQDVEPPITGKLSLKGVTENSVTLQWEPATDKATASDKLKYTVLYKAESDPEWSKAIENATNTTTYTVKGLKPNTKYLFEVKVVDGSNNASFYNKDSDGLLVTTEEEPDVEHPVPGVLSIGEVTHNSVTLNWTKATDNKTKQEELTYMVYCKMGEGEWELLTTLTDATNYVVKDLQPKTVYRFDVEVKDKAENFEEYVPEGLEVTTLATPDNEAPTTGVIGTSNVTYNSITLNWAAASDNMTSIDKLRYTLLYKEKGASEWIEKELGVNVTTYRLEGLKEKTTYWLTVKVCDEEKNCAYYNKLDDPLSVDVPEAPDTQVPHAGVLNVDKVSDSSILVRWTKATDDKTPAEALVYRVAWKAKEETEWHYSVEGEEPWQENLDSYLIEELKADTEYAIELMVMDKAKNKATYGQLTTRTAKPSGIEGVEQEVQEDSAIYDLSGRRQQQLKSGINIVRTKQGKVKRILVK